MLALPTLLLLLQTALPPRPDVRAGLDTLYGGDFDRAAAYFATLAARHPADPAPLVFQAGAYIWWASARDSAAFELRRIDSLLALALVQARKTTGRSSDFWQATALGYRAIIENEREFFVGKPRRRSAPESLRPRMSPRDGHPFAKLKELNIA